jgi:hypothetical protein
VYLNPDVLWWSCLLSQPGALTSASAVHLAAGRVPPGVYPSPDGADVAAPISLFEWLLNFYEEARESKVRPAA